MSHKKYRTETDCLNCGAEVTGKFCPNCGQENLETKENFFHLVGHFIADYFHYDSKFFRSLKSLFTRPGFLTKEYWEGKRVHYIHPLRLFFFVTIIFVIATTYFYNKFGPDMKSRMIGLNKSIESQDSIYLNSLDDSKKIPFNGDSVTVKEFKVIKMTGQRQLNKLSRGIDNVFINLKYVTFFLLPLYALVFKILYRKKRPWYVDHLVYTMHVQSFMYCVLCLLLLVPFFFPNALSLLRGIIFFIMFVYIGFSTYYLYGQPLWKTILKSFLASIALFLMTIISIFIVAGIDAIFIQ